MAVFNKNSLYQVSGFDNPIIAGELVYNQNTFWNLAITNSAGAPVDLTGATVTAQIIRRQLSNVRDSRYGLTFDIADYNPPPSPIPLTITNLNVVAGTFTLVIDSTAWGLISSDPELEIDSINGAGFSGHVWITFPATGNNPSQDNVIFLFFIVRSDGIVVQ